jgi:serine/threonine protein kinase
VKVITGIVLAMRYIHSRGVIHRNLTPDNILLDWDWNVRISNFGRSISSFTNSPERTSTVPSGDYHYVAPECYENIVGIENDVFSFGVILYEVIVGKPFFSRDMTSQQIMGAMVLRYYRPNIPNSILPETAELIRDCWAIDYSERPSFNDILDRLKEMRFKLLAKVNSSKLIAFVKEIEECEIL